jgi:hypothetical protein
MKVIVLVLYLTFSLQNKGPQINYDKSSNQTIASTPTIEVKLKKEDYITKTLEFKIQYAYQGARQKPETANLVFRSLSHRWRFLEESNRLGVLLFTGFKINLSSNPDYTSVIGKKYLEETLNYQISFADLDKIIKAPYLDVHIGEIEGRINEKQLSKIKELLMGLLAGNTK